MLYIHMLYFIMTVSWSQGHFRRGAVLESLGRWVESLAAYFLCLHFSNGSTDVTPIICQVIVAFRNDLAVHT